MCKLIHYKTVHDNVLRNLKMTAKERKREIANFNTYNVTQQEGIKTNQYKYWHADDEQ